MKSYEYHAVCNNKSVLLSGGPHRVGAQRHAAPTASAELGLTVRAQAPAAVSELGFVTDAAGGSVVSVNGAGGCCGLPYDRLPVTGQLLLDSSGTDTTQERTGLGRKQEQQMGFMKLRHVKINQFIYRFAK